MLDSSHQGFGRLVVTLWFALMYSFIYSDNEVEAVRVVFFFVVICIVEPFYSNGTLHNTHDIWQYAAGKCHGTYVMRPDRVCNTKCSVYLIGEKLDGVYDER